MATTTVEEMAASFQEMGTPVIVGHPGGESVELIDAAKAQGWLLHGEKSAAAPGCACLRAVQAQRIW